METIAVIDFETTGLSPEQGARATEIAAVIIHGGRIVSRFQSLMNSGQEIPDFISDLTGITNAMRRQAPPSKQVMLELQSFLRDLPIVAHNASFDKKFYENECRLAGITPSAEFACSMLVSRRLFPDAPNHKLETLIKHLNIASVGQFHRALSDAEMTAELVLEIQRRLREGHNIGALSHATLRKLQRTKYADLTKTLHGLSTAKDQSIFGEKNFKPPEEFIRSKSSLGHKKAEESLRNPKQPDLIPKRREPSKEQTKEETSSQDRDSNQNFSETKESLRYWRKTFILTLVFGAFVGLLTAGELDGSVLHYIWLASLGWMAWQWFKHRV